MASHYAPRTKMMLVEPGDPLPDTSSDEVYIIDCAQDLVKAAHDLYSELRAADAAEASLIIALMPPKEGLGTTLRDRLTKAAADQGRGSANQVG